jgi:hypothetical protein
MSRTVPRGVTLSTSGLSNASAASRSCAMTASMN